MLVNLLLASAAPCYAGGVLPGGGQVVAGSGAIAASGNALTVTQSSARAIINWQSFSIGNGNSVQINNGSGATLNRVIANAPSTIAGSLTSTGSTYLINQNGIVVTPTGKVVTGGSFIGSTRDTSDNNFMQGGAQQFTGVSPGNVVNQGKIVSANGDVVLVGKSVDSSGSVSARRGTAGLVAGDDITLQPSGTGLQIKVATGTGDTTNSGTVDAAQVMLNAAGGNVYALAGNNGGTIRATGTSTINGHVWLTAGGQASVAGAVSAQNADGSGGAITATGRNIDISGILDASALSSFGSGGSASVIAADTTQVTGAIKAHAGNRGGNGGTIETSGNSLQIAGAAIDASAPAGLAGTWLLDPYNLTVATAPSNATEAPTGTWTSNAGGGLVLNTDIDSALNAGTSVVLQTSGTLGDGQGNGDITVAAPILMTGASNASLTLLAAGSINIFQTISSTGGALGVTLNANTLGGGGGVTIGSAISTNGGDLVVGGGANPLTSPAVAIAVNAALNTGLGAISLNGKGFSGGFSASMGVSINAPISGGAISITGTGGDSTSNANYGVFINSAISGAGGTIAITGTGGNSGGIGNNGIYQNANISNTGTGSITLNGTGGSGIGADGVVSLANIIAGTGNIAITGHGGGAAQNGNGAALHGTTISTGGTGTITISGTATGAGAAGVAVDIPTITAVDGLISITGINNSISTSGGNIGVLLNSGRHVTSTGVGGVSLTGLAGGSGASSNNSGVVLNDANTVQSTGGGAITIAGTGGDAGGTGTFNAGVQIGAVSPGALAGSGGAISITGTGGNSSGASNYGIFQSSAITNIGAGSITLSGIGGGSGNNESGYFTTKDVTAGTGNIAITGAASASATGNTNGGIVLSGGSVSTGGSGTITLFGTGTGSGAGSGGQAAVNIGPGSLTAVDGLISVTGINNSALTGGNATGVMLFANNIKSTGTGGVTIAGFGGGSGAGGNNVGVAVNSATAIQVTGGGAIAITGTGGDNGGSGNNNYGVLVGQALSGSGGAIAITGTGGNSSGNNNFGINQTAAITNTGAGSISLSGTGGGSGGSEGGYNLFGGSVVAGTGNISITGHGGNVARDGWGVTLHGTAISTTGAGTITVSGTATGSLSAARVDATVIDMPNITAVDGLISITGINNTAGTIDGNMGVHVNNGSQILSTGIGGVSLTGLAGGSGVSFNNYGIELNAANTIQSTGGGAITITGTGGDAGGSGAFNAGVFIGSVSPGALAGSGGAISITGTGGNSSAANNFGIFQTASISNTGTVGISLTGTPGGSSSLGMQLFSLAAGAGSITLNSSGSVISTGALTGASLDLLGTGGNYNLTNSGNAVTVLTANTGNVNYSQTGDLTIGSVGSTVGVTASGTAKLVSNGGNLSIASGAGATASGTGNALILEAGASTSQPITTGGDFINNAGPGALSTPNGFWLVYTGHKVGSGTVDGGLSYTAQYGTDTSYTPPPSANFMFFRAPPTAVTAALTGTVIKTYDGTLLATLGAGNYNLSGVAPADLSSVILTVNGTAISLPTYGLFSSKNTGSGLLVTVSGLGLNQPANAYFLTATTISANIGTINPALLTISAVSDNKIYDGTTSSSATPTVSGLFTVAGDSVTGLSQAFGSKDVLGLNGSTLSVTGYLVNDGNGGNDYVVDSSATAVGTITPATLVYTADLASKIYGKSNPALSGVLSGLQGVDTQTMVASGTLKFTTGATKSSNVGSYAINGSGLSVISANYVSAIDQDAGNATALTITPAKLTYRADKASRTYGAADPAFSGTVTGFVLDQTLATATTGTLAFTTTALDTSNVGKYAINGSGLTANFGNYYFVQATRNAKALTIDPATLTYIADPASRAFGTSNPSFSGTVTGFVLGQDLASATTGLLKFKSPAKKNSPVGSYAINGSGLSANNGNYVFVQAAANATALAVLP